MDNSLVSIVIPFLNEWQLTHQRLMELYKFAPDNCEIILVDDASPELEGANGISWWQKNGRHKIRYYKNPENVGFGISCNNGAKLAKGKYVVFLSNDVVVYADFITDIVDLIGEDIKMLVAGRIIDFPGGWNEFVIEKKKYVIHYAEGWLIGCTRIAWKELGGFDPIYGKFDYEDLDISTRALSLGYNIVNLRSNKVHHLGSQTISKLSIDRQSITNRNRELFINKWGAVIPTLNLG